METIEYENALMWECFKKKRKCAIVGMRFKNVLTSECVNALVSSRNANETSSWGNGNLADRVVIKIFFQFQKQLYLLHFEKMDV